MRILNEVMDACELAYREVTSLDERAEYAAAIESTHCIVFNSRLTGVLMEIYKKEGKTFAQIRQQESRRFHELLGIYIGDMKEKNRLYKLPTFDGDHRRFYYLRGIILKPELRLERFTFLRPKLLIALSRLGKAEIFKSNMKYVEEEISRFADSHPYAFRRTRFLEGVRLATTEFTAGELQDHLLLGTGFAVKRKAPDNCVPRLKASYVGPFLHFLVRGACEKKDIHFSVLRDTLRLVI